MLSVVMGMRLLLALSVVLAACGGGAGASPTPAPLGAAELKERVMEAAGRIAFCDPDVYPLGRADERDLALRRLPEIQADPATYAAITARVGGDALMVYREWKVLNALQLQAVGEGFGFGYLTVKADKTFERVEGRVTPVGAVTVRSRAPAGPPNCPICLARGTRIAVPGGETAVEDLRAGDIVWTLGSGGDRVAAPLAAIGSTPVPESHQVVQLVLDDGRTVFASPGHPTADGRRVGDLRAGDLLDGAGVVSAERVAYTGGRTFDVLPAGATGAYWANGILLGSTLRADEEPRGYDASSSAVRKSTTRP